jgi:hypothetical protein
MVLTSYSSSVCVSRGSPLAANMLQVLVQQDRQKMAELDDASVWIRERANSVAIGSDSVSGGGGER